MSSLAAHHRVQRPARHTDGLLPLAFEASVLTLTTLGAVHLLLMWVLDFDLVAEVFNGRPLPMAAAETVLTIAAACAAGIMIRNLG